MYNVSRIYKKNPNNQECVAGHVLPFIKLLQMQKVSKLSILWRESGDFPHRLQSSSLYELLFTVFV